MVWTNMMGGFDPEGRISNDGTVMTRSEGRRDVRWRGWVMRGAG